MAQTAEEKGVEIIFVSSVPAIDNTTLNAENKIKDNIIQQTAEAEGAIFADVNAAIEKQFEIALKDSNDTVVTPYDLFYLSPYSIIYFGKISRFKIL